MMAHPKTGRMVALAPVWDHYIPLAAGGSNADQNFVAACQICNSIKGAMAPGLIPESDFRAMIMEGWRLRTKLVIQSQGATPSRRTKEDNQDGQKSGFEDQVDGGRISAISSLCSTAGKEHGRDGQSSDQGRDQAPRETRRGVGASDGDGRHADNGGADDEEKVGISFEISDELLGRAARYVDLRDLNIIARKAFEEWVEGKEKSERDRVEKQDKMLMDYLRPIVLQIHKEVHGRTP